MGDPKPAMNRRMLRSACGVSLIAPVFFAWASGVDLGPVRGAFAPWRRIATWLFLPIAAYLLVAPFVYDFYRRSRKRLDFNSRGAEREVIFLTGTAGATAVVGLTFLLVVFGGGSRSEMYGWSAISFVVAAFWSLRCRRLIA